MTRIIAGHAGGRTVRTPTGTATRPTTDRVREALFSALTARDRLTGAVVLDAYAGSGALGLEAASRGAHHVDLVESHRLAITAITHNLRALALPGVRLHAMTVASFLARGADTAYDLALLDPPYDLADAALGDVLTALVPHLADDALVVVERSGRSPEPPWPAGLAREKPRRYGETTLWLAGRC